MIWNYGKTYRKIRREKGITQKEICGESLSRTTLSKFESCKLNPSFQTFEFLLKQIDMTFEEFLYIARNVKTEERERIITSFFSSVSNVNVIVLKKIAVDSENYLETCEDVAIEEILEVSRALIEYHRENDTDNHCLPKVFVNKIWERLSKMDFWYLKELRLLNCILFLFPIETTVELVPRILKCLSNYEHYADIVSLKISILLNLSTLFFQQKMADKCILVSKEALKYSKNAKRYDLYAFCMFRLGVCESDKKKVEKAKELLRTIEEKELLGEIEKEYLFWQSY